LLTQGKQEVRAMFKRCKAQGLELPLQPVAVKGFSILTHHLITGPLALDRFQLSGYGC
jgi:hypothetical protein